MELTPILPKEYCWIRSCKNYMTCTPGVDLYPLPADVGERAQWVQAFGLKGFANDNTRICGAHFKRMELSPILPKEYCWIPSCKNYLTYTPGVDLYSLPADVGERAQWVHAFGLKGFATDNTRICGAHFKRMELSPIIPKEYCWFPSCKNYMTYTPGVDLYPLPADDGERAQWVQAFGLKGFANDNTRICGAHFKRMELTPIMPKEPPKEPPKDAPKEYCWIRSCKNYMTCTPGVDLYPLPANKDERALWEQAFGLKGFTNDNTRICGAHFKRKYFLKSDGNQSINGADDKSLRNIGGHISYSRSSLNHMNKNIVEVPVVSNTNFVYVTLTNQNAGSTCIERSQVPQPKSPIEVHVEPNKPCLISTEAPNKPCVISTEAPNKPCLISTEAPNKPSVISTEAPNKPSVISTEAPNKPCLISTEAPNKPCLISTEETSNLYCPEALQPLINDSCELFLYCKEENLTPEQQKFQADEWMNYVKFQANIHHLPYISAVKEPDSRDQPPKSVASPELPVLVYSNSATSTKSLEPFVPSSVVSNAPIVGQIPSKVSSSLNINNVPLTQCNIPPIVSNQPSIFPVKLERSVAKSTDKNILEQSNQEEILPFVLTEEGSPLSLLNKVSDPPTKGNFVLGDSSEQMFKNGMDSAPSPSSQCSGSSDRCISPELLCNLEVNVEEAETDSLPVEENTSNSLCSDVASDNSNGPKIIGVVSGDAGATEFFKDIFSNQALEKDSYSLVESGSSSDNNVVYSNESLMPKTVTQFSIFSMQKTIAVISSGTTEANIHNLLGVRQHIPPNVTAIDFTTKLKNKLREEMFMTLSPWWMIKQRFLPLNPPCSTCGGKVFRLNSCYEFLDSLCWTCDNSNCREIYPVERPKFFARFPSFSLEELLLLTYHWACKSRLWVITKDVPVHEERIWGYFTALQELCGNYIERNGQIGKNPRHPITVEASAVKLGKYFILCAYDRKHKVSRLQALTTEEACGSIKHLRILQQWLGNHCTLITWKKINEDFLPGVTKVAADPTIGSIQSIGRHILNASRYLGKTMVQLFQNICHDELTIESLQGILNEVQWRERVGTTEESAFWGIMNEISSLNINNSSHYTEAIQGEISKDRFFNKADINFRLRWGVGRMGQLASPTYTIFDKDGETQQTIPRSAVSTIKKMLNSSTPTVSVTPQLNNIENDPSKPLHPIRIVGLAPPVTVPTKEKDSVSAQELLSIKMTFPGEDNNEKEFQAVKLGTQLRREGFLIHPIRWLVKNKYIKDEGSCYVCQGKAKLVDNPKFSDGVSWLCQKSHCMFDNRYKRPKFFAHFGFKMDVILATIFHWAVQSDYYTTWKSIPLNHFNIISIHRRLQQICAEVTGREEFKIGGKQSLVEVAFVRFSNCFILGAMERDTTLSRFRTFSIEAKLHIDEIRKTLISWLRQGSTVVVNSNKYLGRYCMEERINLVFADKTVADVKSKKYHTLTITTYLQRHIKGMFRNTKSQYLSADLLQVYMDELVWRERYRKSPFQCIMRDIFAVEYGESNFMQISNGVLLKKAAAFYGFSLPLPEIKIPLQRLPEHVINSYTSPDVDTDTDTDEVTIIEHVDVRKEIKVETISDDDDENEEIEVDKIEIEAPKTQISPVASTSISSQISPVASTSISSQISPVASTSISSQNDDTELYFVSEKNPVAGTSKSQFLVNKSISDKSYSRKKKDCDETSNWRLQCMECRDTVTVDHFLKPYNCSDCKYNVYSTYCQKAFARHRSFILFGRKFSECYQNTKKLLLPQQWYCICGYSSLEGNELASHLIDCKKSTCYLNILKPSSIL